jgi:hypothetical protein
VDHQGFLVEFLGAMVRCSVHRLSILSYRFVDGLVVL